MIKFLENKTYHNGAMIRIATTIVLDRINRFSNKNMPPHDVVAAFLQNNWNLINEGKVITISELENMRGEDPIPDGQFDGDQEHKDEAITQGIGIVNNAVEINQDVPVLIHRTQLFVPDRNGNAVLLKGDEAKHEVDYLTCLYNGFHAYKVNHPYYAADKIEGMDMILSAFLYSIPKIKQECKKYILDAIQRQKV